MWSTYYQEIYVKQECSWEPMMLTVIGCLQVGWPLSFFTLGIEYHHIHHLNPRVPAYRLQDCHNAAKHLFQLVPRVTLRSFLRCDFVSQAQSIRNSDRRRYTDCGATTGPCVLHCTTRTSGSTRAYIAKRKSLGGNLIENYD